MSSKNLAQLCGLAAILAGILRGVNSFILSDAPIAAILYLLTDIFILLGIIGIYGFQHQESRLWGFLGFLLAIIGIVTIRTGAIAGINLYPIGALTFTAGLSSLAVGSWIARKLPQWVSVFWILSTVIGFIGYFVPGFSLFFVISGIIFGIGFAGAGAALAAGKIANGTAYAAPNPDHETDVAELIQRSSDSNAALMRGDIDTYQTLIAYTNDFTLMSPFGGTPSRGLEYTPERMAAMGRFFKNGVFKQEVVQSYASADMVVLAIIEHQNVEVGGLPAQEWPLRVTLVYRREGAEWRLAHRHADPLVMGISLEQAAALARGDK